MPVQTDFRIVDDFYLWEAYQGINNGRTIGQFRIVDNYYLYLVILGRGGAAYKKYVALLNQAGTAAPTATIYDNTIGTIVLTRVGQGVYRATSTGNLPLAGRVVFFGAGNAQFIPIYQPNGLAPHYIEFETDDLSGNGQDDLLINTPIEIRVYT